ncbi:MAG: exo-alpha-sialidase [Verrucomicrobia bacterium]|nr:exo-alpha-sialidase [Verrucomicrobiota bacterium]
MNARLVSRSVFVPSPGDDVAVIAASFYTRRDGLELVSFHSQMTRGDVCDVTFRRYSTDNGRTWSAVEELPAFERRPEGTLRRFECGGYVDTPTDRLLTFRIEGILPTDDPLEGMKHYALYYTVSEDGGRTQCVNEPIIHAGNEFDAKHPLPGVWIGKNAVMLGDLPSRPLTLADGTILLPTQITPIGPNGEYYNPGGGYTYTDALVLRGRWRADKRVAWSAARPVAGDPNRSTRGMIEPTLGLLADGRVLMVMRGSNEGKSRQGGMPGYRWHSVSSDGGVTWTEPAPWRYTNGKTFFSPSSCSQLLAHPSGALLWFGNICDKNPCANSPRYPFVVAEVDRESGLLRRDSLCVLDDRGNSDSEALMLSNFYAREDRPTGDVIVHITRLFAKGPGRWGADALMSRISVISDQ